MIYFASCGPFVKIGHTKRNLWLRLEDIQSGTPDYIELLAVIDGNARTEMDIHLALEEHRHRGEWFRLNDSVREFIATLTTITPPLPDAASIERGRSIFCTNDGWFITSRGRARGPFRTRTDAQKLRSTWNVDRRPREKSRSVKGG